MNVIQAVSCPTCGVRKGTPCRSTTSGVPYKPGSYVHRARLDKFGALRTGRRR